MAGKRSRNRRNPSSRRTYPASLRSSDFFNEPAGASQESRVSRDRSHPAYQSNPYRKSRPSSTRRTTQERRRTSAGAAPGYASSRRPVSADPRRRMPAQQAHLKLEKPWRLGGVLLVLVVLMVFIVSKVVGGGSTTVEEEKVHTFNSDESTADIPAAPVQQGRTIPLSDVSSQLSGYLGGLIAAYSDNYAHDPEKPEEEPVIPNKQTEGYTRCVVLDAAHGGEDEGYCEADLIEKAWNLAMASLIQEKIRSIDSSIEVVLTRDADQYMELEDRIKRSDKVGADLFVSIHCGYNMDDASESGLYTQYYMDEEESERCELSKQAAVRLAEAMSMAVDLRNRGSEASVQEVLYETKMPAVVLQIGHITNESDLKILMDEECLDKLAKAIAREIVDLVQSFPEREKNTEEESEDSEDTDKDPDAASEDSKDFEDPDAEDEDYEDYVEDPDYDTDEDPEYDEEEYSDEDGEEDWDEDYDEDYDEDWSEDPEEDWTEE